MNSAMNVTRELSSGTLEIYLVKQKRVCKTRSQNTVPNPLPLALLPKCLSVLSGLVRTKGIIRN